MNLFKALEWDRALISRKSPCRFGGKMMRELKVLESNVNYDGSNFPSKSGQRGERALYSYQ